MSTKSSKDTVLAKLDAQVRDFWQRLESEGRGLGKRLEETAERLQNDLNTRDLSRRAQALQRDLSKKAAGVTAQAFHAAGLATRSDVEKLNKKLNALSKKLNAA